MNTHSTDSRDAETIAVDIPGEVAFWAKEFKISRARLKQAVKAVGPMVNDVGAWLARN